MAKIKEKAFEEDQKTTIPAGGRKDELSEKDLEKAAGGGAYQDGEDGTMRTRPGKT